MIDQTKSYFERQKPIKELLALVENPKCARNVLLRSQNKIQEPELSWNPKSSFLHWALDPRKLSDIFQFRVHITDASARSPNDLSNIKDGEALIGQELILEAAGKPFSLYPDILLKKIRLWLQNNFKRKIILFCLNIHLL